MPESQTLESVGIPFGELIEKIVRNNWLIDQAAMDLINGTIKTGEEPCSGKCAFNLNWGGELAWRRYGLFLKDAEKVRPWTLPSIYQALLVPCLASAIFSAVEFEQIWPCHTPRLMTTHYGDNSECPVT